MKLKSIFAPCNLYLFCWILYVQQGLLYRSGSIISRSLLLILLIISIINVYKVIKHFQLPIFFKGLNILLIMFTVYGAFFWLFNPGGVIAGDTSLSGYEYLKRIYMSLLPIYSIYLYTQTGALKIKNLRIWIVIFIFSAYGEYLIGVQNNLNYLMEMGSSRTEFTNNTGYLFLCLIPALYVFQEKPYYQYIGLAVLIFFTIASMKRGAILGVVIVATIFIFKGMKTASNTKKILFALLSCAVIFFVANYVKDMMTNSDYFMARLNRTLEGDSSGRDKYYKDILNAFINETNLLYIMFGRGAYGSVSIIGNLAHNDWLEILIGQGLFGIGVFLYFAVCFYKSFNKLNRNSPIYMMLLLSFIIFYYKTCITMSYDDMPIYLSTIVGYALSVSFTGNYNNSTQYDTNKRRS